MSPSRQFGPWAPDLDLAELRARLRSLRAIARLLAGPRASTMCDHLRDAETDPAALEPAADALDRLAPLDRRAVLASYAGLTRPLPIRGTLLQARPFIRVRPRPGVSRHAAERLVLRPRLRAGHRLVA